MRIAIDGMGGDHAPSVVVEGAIAACKEYGFEIVIVGQQEKIEAELGKIKYRGSKVEICHASEVIDMHELPVASVRKKKDSSINKLVELAKNKKVDAILSAGNTGAVVCATTLGLRLLEGVERPGIAIVYRGLEGISMIIDIGANVNAKPSHLLQYALMGDAYSRYILKKENPKIGLLNVGEEAAKGPEFIKETHRLLSSTNLNFIGNTEGDELFNGKIDVIVCDGFIGNAVLKVSEGIAEAFSELLHRKLSENLLTKFGALLSMPAFKALKKEVDYAEYGGAPLLGVDGICIIGHGRSNSKAIKNAIRAAGESATQHVNQHIIEAIACKKELA